jgi:hypothetical protein
LCGPKKSTTKPTADQLAPREDIEEALAMQATAEIQLIKLNKKAKVFARLTAPIIDRQGQNHYIQTLFHHYPKGTP